MDQGSPYDDDIAGEAAAQDMVRGLESALADDHPLPFLAQASSMSMALSPRRDPQLEEMSRLLDPDTAEDPMPPQPELPEASEMMAMFVESGQTPMQAMAYGLSRFSGNDLDRIRVERQLGVAVQQFPRWLQSMDEAEPIGALMAPDPVLAGTNLAIGVRLHSGHHLTLVGFVDFDLGSALTDAFVLDVSLDDYVSHWREIGGEVVVDQVPISFADVRARFEAAIETGDMTIPPYETDSWPPCRPLLEWVLRKLPAGGEPFPDRYPDTGEEEAIIDGFLDSRHGKPWRSDPDTRSLMDTFFGFRGPQNDPLLWSTKAVEIFLGDYAARKVLADDDYMHKFPDVLAAFIRYGHEHRGVPDVCTAEALAAVAQYESEFLTQLARRDRQASDVLGPAGAALRGMLGAEGVADIDWDDVDFSGLLSGLSGPEELETLIAGNNLGHLQRRTGGPDALEALDDAPLPVDEPMNLAGIDADIVDRVTEVCGHVDDACQALFEPEARTAARRILHDIAFADPAIFRRKSAADTAAAAVCWITMINNIGDGAWNDTWVTVKDLMAHFGRKGSPSQRAAPMLAALGLPYGPTTPFDLGDVRYLTSSTREVMITHRDRWMAQLAQE